MLRCAVCTSQGGVIEADPSNKLGHPCATLFIPPCSETVREVTVTGETLPFAANAATSSAGGSSGSSTAAVRVLCDGEQLLSNSQDCIGCAAPQTAVPTAALHGAAQVRPLIQISQLVLHVFTMHNFEHTLTSQALYAVVHGTLCGV
jgi:hypothetical protein